MKNLELRTENSLPLSAPANRLLLPPKSETYDILEVDDYGMKHAQLYKSHFLAKAKKGYSLNNHQNFTSSFQPKTLQSIVGKDIKGASDTSPPQPSP